jgi:murein DD-endopeptidase MepM/ murein hydrolase activator NlpD
MMPQSARWIVMLAIVFLPAGVGTADVLPEVEAAPGTLVRWVGDGTEECAMDGRRWSALDDTCWFPVDLLREDSVIEVSRWRREKEERARIRIGDYPYSVQYIALEDESRVTLSDENLVRVRREQQLVGALWNLDGPARFTLPLESPLRDRGSSGRFGSRRFFNQQPRSPHTGADYSAAAGEPVFSVADGQVVLADDLFFSGFSAFIDHGDGLVSMYFHFSEILVEKGEDVTRGQQIGRVGQTGRATGPHLHFGVRWRGARIDPELLLEEPSLIASIP